MSEDEDISFETENRFKLIKMLEAEHDQIISLYNEEGEGSDGEGPFVILIDDTYNKYEIDDIVKTEYGTFWKITGITYCFRYTENPEFERCIWDTKHKMVENMKNHGQREYSIIYLDKLNNDEAMELMDDTYNPSDEDPYGC